MLRLVDLQEFGHERIGVIVVEDSRASLLVAGGEDLGNDLGNPTCAVEDTNELSFIVGDGQLAERPAAAADNDDDVRRPDVDHLAAHKAATGEDEHIVEVRRRFVLVDVLV